MSHRLPSLNSLKRDSYIDVAVGEGQPAARQEDLFSSGDDFMELTFPNDQQRLTIVGKTGSGKTHAGLWHLSRRDYDVKPWIVYDFKGDELINSIDGIMELSVNAEPPEEPGLYIVRPIPEDDDDAVANQMKAIWQAEDIGVFIDEGYMIGNRNKSFRLLLTQGRSKHIPMIVLSQRPVWMDRFVFSEADFFQVFRLQSDRDWDQVKDWIPFKSFGYYGRKDPADNPLPDFYSYYYDSKANNLRVVKAVPDRAAILNTFNRRLEGVRKV